MVKWSGLRVGSWGEGSVVSIEGGVSSEGNTGVWVSSLLVSVLPSNLDT